MPRANTGPRLELFGPDSKFGATPKKGFTQYVYYIVWSHKRRTKVRSTNTCDLGQAGQELAKFLLEQPDETTGPRAPNEISVAEVLELYLNEHVPTLRSTKIRKEIGRRILTLLDFWQGPVSDVKGATCRRYAKQRVRQPQPVKDRPPPKRARKSRAKPGANSNPVSSGTVRNDLVTLKAAIGYCFKEGYLTLPVPVELPEKPARRERWLTRAEAAALLRAVRRRPRSRFHLALFILIALYTGARHASILQLQWVPNMNAGHIDLARGMIDFNGLRPRTKKRRAVIPIPPRLRVFLRLARKRTRQHVIEYEGAPIASIWDGFKKAAQKAGLGPEVTIHTTKHTAITWYLQLGVPTWEVAGWVETSEKTIREVYGHHAPDHLAAARTAHNRRV